MAAMNIVMEKAANYLVHDALAELTLSILQKDKLRNPEEGYAKDIEVLAKVLYPGAFANGMRVVTNSGGLNPESAAKRVKEILGKMGVTGIKIATITGDDVLSRLGELQAAGEQLLNMDTHVPYSTSTYPATHANVYIGAKKVKEALDQGANLILAGRVADPSLVLGPALAHYGWALDDWDRLARATMAGHLLECGAQVSGGYFADPGYKDVAGLAQLGYPIAEIDADGHCTITKPPGTGGCITERTVKEQLLYELHDPAAYLTPDVVADITTARVTTVGADAVRLEGVQGHARPATLKVNVCFESGWFAEGEISYAGPRAEARARLAGEVLRERLHGLGPLRIDLIGVTSIFGDDTSRWLDAPASDSRDTRDVRLRVALQHRDHASAQRLVREVTALYTCGPAGGGGVRTAMRPRLGTVSCLVPRDAVAVRFEMVEPLLQPLEVSP